MGRMADSHSSENSSDDATRILPGQETVILAKPADSALPEPAPADAAPASPAAGIVRYGPGVPVDLSVGQGGRTVEHIWRGGKPPAPTRSRLRRIGGWALSAVLIATSGILLFLRYYSPPLHVTAVTVTTHDATGCQVDLTAHVTTNGGAGAITYQWLFEPDEQPATTLRQSVSRGQHAADLTMTVDSGGHGTVSQTAILQILSPNRRTASIPVALTC
jgi:hypothetical protein